MHVYFKSLFAIANIAHQEVRAGQQRNRRHFQRASQSIQGAERRVRGFPAGVFVALEVGNLIAGYSRALGELLLSETSKLAEGTKITRELQTKRGPVCVPCPPRHALHGGSKLGSSPPTRVCKFWEFGALCWLKPTPGQHGENLEIDVARSVQAVSRVSQTRHDVRILIEFRIDRSGDEPHG